jgi:hypothetical protein
MFATKKQFFTKTSGYQISKSLRFRASASAYLNRTFGTATDLKTMSLSIWFKRGTLGAESMILSCGTGGTDCRITFTTGDALQIFLNNVTYRITSRLFRDPAAWMHILVVIDTANATAQNRARVYVNGVEETSFSTNTAITVNATFNLNSNVAHNFGRWAAGGSSYFDGEFAEVNFIDGQALTPSSFGAIDANGVWSPIQYTGTYGANGFYLPFTDNSGATATTIGKDYSGNGNNWTPNNISVTSGVTYDSMIDSPTNAASGTQPVGNYCVISPLDENFTTSTAVVSDGNLKFALSSTPANQQVCRGTMAGVSKFYFEVVTLSVGAGLAFGVKTTGAQLTSSGGLQASASWEILCSNGNKWNGSSVAYGSAYTTNDVGMCAVDPVNGKIWFGKNGTWFASGDPAAGTNAAFTNVVSSVQPLFECGVSTDSIAANFGQRPFTYTPPSGYQALCTANLATPTIKNGAQYMAATTYTGTGATQTITNTVNSKSFQPDLVWIKSRSAATNHNLFDAIRGTTNYLISNSTAANASNVNTLTAFGSTGFTLGSDASSIGVNVNTATYVGWQWLAGSGTTSSNPNGSITSTVCVNTTAGFSIVTSASNVTTGGTLGHGLGVAPAMILLKNRAVVANWGVYHQSANASPASGGMYLNLTNAFTSSAGFWNSVAPTSTVFSIGSSFAGGGANDILAYCFAPITGYSAFGSYTGNGSTDGPFVYCGFKPRWIMVKGSTYASNWNIIDSSRTSYNADTAINLWLRANDATAAGDISGVNFSGAGLNGYVDFLSNGFKFRGAASDVNSNTNTLIYAAFAENPFNISRAR